MEFSNFKSESYKNATNFVLCYESKFYEESSLYGQTPAKILADVKPK